MPLSPLEVLRSKFGFDSFLPGQSEIISSILDGYDTLAIRPTGSGKSICFQVPALILPGTTVVISPLISLMKDQVEALRRHGIAALAIHSGMDLTQMRQSYGQVSTGKIKLVYISPERATNGTFPMVLKSLLSRNLLARIVVDEAHCISEWGREFRPSYQRLMDLRTICRGVPVIALTATAIPRIQEEICLHLGFGDNFKTFLSHFDRDNLSYEVCPTPMNKDQVLLELLETDFKPPGIIFCATRRSVEDLHLILENRGICSLPYHGGMGYFQRQKNQEYFLKGKVPWMIATTAFGMGIHKEDLRTVVHYHLPGSLEQYIQECGRAGRDGFSAKCFLLYSIADRRIHEALMTHSRPSLSMLTELLEVIYSHNPFWETNESELLKIIHAESRLANQSPWEEKSLQKYMGILEKCGWIQWIRDRGIWTVIRESKPPPFQEIEQMILNRVNDSFSRLNIMEKFCTHQGCLREFLHGELGGTHAFKCDNCSGCSGKYQVIIDEDNPMVQSILDFVHQYPQHTRITTIASVLSGSKSKSLRDRGLHRSSHYGLLKDYTQSHIRETARNLIYAGRIQRYLDFQSLYSHTA